MNMVVYHSVIQVVPLWYKIISTIIAALSVISNIVVLRIWLKKNIRNQTTILLSVLAISDSIAAVGCVGQSISPDLSDKLCACLVLSIVNIIGPISHTLSILITTLIAVQRFFVCAFPYKGQRICNKLVSLLYCIITCAATTTFLTVYLLKVVISGSVMIDSYNSSFTMCKYEYVFTINRDNDQEFSRIRFLVLQVIPLILITISMTFCMYTVYVRKHMLATNEAEQKEMNRTTVMIFFLMIVFTIGELPATLSFYVRSFIPETTNKFLVWIGYSLEGAVYIPNIMVIVSYFMNIWIYILTCRQFRQELCNIFCCGK